MIRPMTQHKKKLRYEIYVREDGHEFLEAACNCEYRAKKNALALVDDVLPRNTVRVFDTREQREIGCAFFAGEGEHWRDIPRPDGWVMPPQVEEAESEPDQLQEIFKQLPHFYGIPIVPGVKYYCVYLTGDGDAVAVCGCQYVGNAQNYTDGIVWEVESGTEDRVEVVKVFKTREEAEAFAAQQH